MNALPAHAGALIQWIGSAGGATGLHDDLRAVVEIHHAVSALAYEQAAVYGCLFVGKGAYGVVDLNDGTEVIVKPRGSSGTADPLDQRSSVGWKGVHAAAILYDEYIVRVECGSSYSGQDKAN